MPYVDTEWAVIVEGSLPGSENWANRWTIQETAVGADLDDAATAFRTFYIAWSGVCDDAWTATSITFRNLVNSTVITPSWATVTGGVANDPLPTECALRISLSAAGNRHGGPFLSGVSSVHTDGQGQMAVAALTGVASGLEDLFTDLVTADFALRMDSPTDTETKAITQCRIGRTFDVIRKRRNATAEDFINIPVAP